MKFLKDQASAKFGAHNFAMLPGPGNLMRSHTDSLVDPCYSNDGSFKAPSDAPCMPMALLQANIADR